MFKIKRLSLIVRVNVVLNRTVNNNSPIQDYVHPDDQTQPFETTPGFKPFTMFKIFFAAKCCVDFYCPTQVRDRVDSGPSNFIQQNHKFGDKNLNLLISVYKNWISPSLLAWNKFFKLDPAGKASAFDKWKPIY